ncbi:IS66 family insertion sequence element accessory protein TnpB [Catalinimonas sp. 4WD22]|uniref:IS66 family insertion sequence element accessory protein TnpA n=1 Tax=Catalinimonas locisalis TaxID=3133978 RepID=UPI003101166A
MEQQEKMLNLVEYFHRSGKSQKEFCLEQGIKTSTFSYWIKKKRLSENSKEAFLKIEPTTPLLKDQVEVFYPNGVRLKITQTDLSTISALIRLY